MQVNYKACMFHIHVCIHRNPSVYDDVVEALKKWKEQNVPVYIYSSGSIEAQVLLFTHSNHGNLMQYLSGNFDTTSGYACSVGQVNFCSAKVEAGSYKNILESINLKRKQENSQLIEINTVLFLTDNILEAEAAKAAGMQTALVFRPGNKPLPEKVKFPVIKSFDELKEKYSFESLKREEQAK